MTLAATPVSRPIDWGARTLVMGVLNLTPDSFSDGGRLTSVSAALKAATRMLAQGADLLDLGGQSTRPGAELVGAAVEWQRLQPVLVLELRLWQQGRVNRFGQVRHQLQRRSPRVR